MKAAHDRIALVHAIFGSLAALIVFPAALLVGRLRRKNPQWWRWHALINVAGALLIILTFGLGLGSVAVGGEGQQLSGDEADVHHLLGLAIFLIVMVQIIIGAVSHYVFRPSTMPSSNVNDEKVPSNHWQTLSTTARLFRSAHIFIGVVTAGLLYWITWNGIDVERDSMAVNESKTPESVKIIYWIVVALPIALYIAHAGTGALQHVESTGKMTKEVN